MTNTSTLLDEPVSWQQRAWAPLSKELTLKEVFADIKSRNNAKLVGQLRDLLNQEKLEEYNYKKKMLPAVTFCGTFDKIRKKESIKRYTQLLVLDIDKLSDDQLKATKECLLTDKHIFSFWESPSKKGLKGLLRLEYPSSIAANAISNIHSLAFKKVAEYYFEKYNIELDESGSDTTRLCFYSYDPDLILKDRFAPFVISDLKEHKAEKPEKPIAKPVKNASKHRLYNADGKNDPKNRLLIKSIISYLNKKKLSITHSYTDWVRVAYAIAASFTYDVGVKHFTELSRMDAVKFDESECQELLKYCYENSRGENKFSTIVYLATQKGYIAKQKGEFLSGSQQT